MQKDKNFMLPVFILFWPFMSSAWNLSSVNETECALEKCISLLIQKLFLRDETFYLVSEENEEIVFPHEIKNPRIVLVSKPPELTSEFYNAFIIYTKTYNSLSIILHKLQGYPIWKSSTPRGKFLIVTPRSKNLLDYFEILFSFDIVNAILVMYTNEYNTISLYSYSLFTVSCACGKRPQPHFIGGCTTSPSLIFNLTMKNLNGCAIKLVTEHKVMRGLKERPTSSILFNMIDALAQILNSSVTYLVTPNLTSSLHDKSEAIIFSNEHLRPDTRDDYDFSDIVHQDQLVWIVPKARRVPNVRLILSIFKKKTWTAIGVVLAVTILVLWLISKLSFKEKALEDVFDYFLVILAYSVGGSSNFIPITNSLKCLIFFYLFYCMVISTMFQANLATDLTQPRYEHGIRTVEELADSSLPLALYKKSASLDIRKSYAYRNEHMKIYERIVCIKVLNASVFLEKVAFDRNISMLLGEKSIRLFPKEKSLITLIHGDAGLPNSELSIFMRKGHYFMPTFNKLIRRMIEGGFPEKIMSDAQQYNHQPREKSQKNIVISLDHLVSVFVIWGFGVLAAVVVFLGEILRYFTRK